MKDRVLRAPHGFDAAGDQLFAALAEDLDRDVVRDEVFLDQPTTKIEFDLRRAGEANLDFLESDPDEHFKILEFFAYAHRLGESLVAIPEVDAAPDGGARERAV